MELEEQQRKLIHLRQLSDDMQEEYLETIHLIYGEGNDFSVIRTLCYGLIDDNPVYGNMEPVEELFSLIESFVKVDIRKYILALFGSADVLMPHALSQLEALFVRLLNRNDTLATLKSILHENEVQLLSNHQIVRSIYARASSERHTNADDILRLFENK
ncbi:hypothetical protein [Spirosoma sp. KUDC1026]|uniref:hypothetical protein n=1 Tax=Spirosoma sp. KUDC1026 TaxID=2745947 RepID=UPI00159BC8BB|nr:hypothetical protein [Spirosoma sp. KUDC1026]QKZ12462.1 hypothetical protein HU175_07405 [Spirosoma sp. KUDC1026]